MNPVLLVAVAAVLRLSRVPSRASVRFGPPSAVMTECVRAWIFKNVRNEAHHYFNGWIARYVSRGRVSPYVRRERETNLLKRTDLPLHGIHSSHLHTNYHVCPIKFSSWPAYEKPREARGYVGGHNIGQACFLCLSNNEHSWCKTIPSSVFHFRRYPCSIFRS